MAEATNVPDAMVPFGDDVDELDDFDGFDDADEVDDVDGFDEDDDDDDDDGWDDVATDSVDGDVVAVDGFAAGFADADAISSTSFGLCSASRCASICNRLSSTSSASLFAAATTFA